MSRLRIPETYGPELALKIEMTGNIALSIANRWISGWPDRVVALLKARTYLECLKAQVEVELDVIAETPNMQHLAYHEILEMHGVTQSPPLIGERFGPIS